MEADPVQALTTAREQEVEAARRPPGRARPRAPASEPLAMLLRRGFRAKPSRLDLPVPEDADDRTFEALFRLLDRYSFRLFLRGAIGCQPPFLPDETTRYVAPDQVRAHAEALVALGLAERVEDGRYRLARRPASFGPTLEWYVARELTGLGFEVTTGVRFGARGVGGDLDVVACAEGRLLYCETKSSPPKHLSSAEVAAFLDRVGALRPDLAMFLMDTSLRLADKVLPMLAEELAPRGIRDPPRQLRHDVWALTPHVFAVGAKPSLSGNVACAVAEGLLACGPSLTGR